MSLIAKAKPSNNIAPLEPGIYTGICVGLADLGEQKNPIYNNYHERVLLFFEIVGEFVDVGDGEAKPRWLSKEFTKSLHSRSNLAKTLKSWRNMEFTQEETDGGFDLKQMVGQACQLQVMLKESSNDGREFNVIENIMGLAKGTTVREPISDLLIFDMDDMPKAEETFPKLPQWVRDRIQKSTEWPKLHRNSEDLDISMEEVATTTNIEATPAQTPQKTEDEVPF